MPVYREFRFEIDAGYTAETIPLARLAQYLQELCVVLGDERHIHLLKVESGSAIPVFVVEDEAADRVRERAAAVRRGTAPAEAMKGYRKLNRMLREDHGHDGRAGFFDDTAEIIPFPGSEAEMTAEPISGIYEQGTIDGKLEKIGGPKDWAPIHLRTMDQDLISHCFARKPIIEQLGHFMNKPVRLYGRGKWGRSVDGRWSVERFVVDSFTPLKPSPLSSVVANLRKIRSDWAPDPVASLNALRHGNGEDE